MQKYSLKSFVSIVENFCDLLTLSICPYFLTLSDLAFSKSYVVFDIIFFVEFKSNCFEVFPSLNELFSIFWQGAHSAVWVGRNHHRDWRSRQDNYSTLRIRLSQFANFTTRRAGWAMEARWPSAWAFLNSVQRRLMTFLISAGKSWLTLHRGFFRFCACFSSISRSL